jgi:biotin carboxylase
MKHVLLVNSGKSNLIRELEDDPFVDLTVLTEERFRSKYRPETKLALVGDIANLAEAKEAAVRAAPPGGTFDAIVALSERSISTGGFLRSFFGLRGFGFDTANACTNKYAMKRAFAAAKLPVAPFALAARPPDVLLAAEHLGWPVVVKPMYGSGAADTFVIADREALTGPAGAPLRAELERLRQPATPSEKTYPLVVERFVDVRGEYHCDGIVFDGEVRFASVCKYFGGILENLGRLVGSYTVERDRPEAQEILDLHRGAVAAVGLRDGVTHMEALETPEGLLVGEIACRPGGLSIPETLMRKYGIDIWRAYRQVSFGEEPDVEVVEAPGTVLGCCLPAKLGRIAYVTPAERFWEIPETVDVKMEHTSGSVVSGLYDSAQITGMVLLHTNGREDVRRLLADVDERYELRMASLA